MSTLELYNCRLFCYCFCHRYYFSLSLYFYVCLFVLFLLLLFMDCVMYFISILTNHIFCLRLMYNLPLANSGTFTGMFINVQTNSFSYPGKSIILSADIMWTGGTDTQGHTDNSLSVQYASVPWMHQCLLTKHFLTHVWFRVLRRRLINNWWSVLLEEMNSRFWLRWWNPLLAESSVRVINRSDALQQVQTAEI